MRKSFILWFLEMEVWIKSLTRWNTTWYLVFDCANGFLYTFFLNVQMEPNGPVSVHLVPVVHSQEKCWKWVEFPFKWWNHQDWNHKSVPRTENFKPCLVGCQAIAYYCHCLIYGTLFIQHLSHQTNVMRFRRMLLQMLIKITMILYIV